MKQNNYLKLKKLLEQIEDLLENNTMSTDEASDLMDKVMWIEDLLCNKDWDE